MADGGHTPKAMTPKAATAFRDYVSLGPDRSLAKLAVRYQTSTKPAPTKHVETLKRWSTDYGWQDRIADAVTEQTQAMLEEANELDATTFLATSREYARRTEMIAAMKLDAIHPLRDRVKPTPKSEVSVKHSGTVRHDHRDLSVFTDEEIANLSVVAERAKAGQR